MSNPELHANDWLLILSIKSTWKILNNMNVLDSSETFSFDNFNKPVEQMRLPPLCWHSAFSLVNISHLSNKLLSSEYQLPSFLKPNLYRHTIFIAFFFPANSHKPLSPSTFSSNPCPQQHTWLRLIGKDCSLLSKDRQPKRPFLTLPTCHDFILILGSTRYVLRQNRNKPTTRVGGSLSGFRVPF